MGVYRIGCDESYSCCRLIFFKIANASLGNVAAKVIAVNAGRDD